MPCSPPEQILYKVLVTKNNWDISMDIGWLIGFIGGMLLAIAYLPQAKRVYDRRKEGLKDISVAWLAIGLSGTILMLGYGFIINQPSIVVLNTIVLCVYSFMLSLAVDRKPSNVYTITIDRDAYKKAVETKPLTFDQYQHSLGWVNIPLLKDDELSQFMMNLKYDDKKGTDEEST